MKELHPTTSRALVEELRSRLSGCVLAGNFARGLISNYNCSLPETNSYVERKLRDFRTYFHSSFHYRTEIQMYRTSLKLLIRDMARRQSTSDIPPEQIINALMDCLMVGYAMDDLVDHSPVRGDLPAYHIITDKETVVEIYEFAKLKLYQVLDGTIPGSGEKLMKLIDGYESASLSEGSTHYYSIDLDGYHTVDNMFAILHQKASFLSQFVLEPIEQVVGLISEDWREGLATGYEAAWLVNDYFKNASDASGGKWLELKSGRLPLPVVLALHLMNEEDKEKTTQIIEEIWVLYKPVFESEMSFETINEMNLLDHSAATTTLLKKFSDLLSKSKVSRIINHSIDQRVRRVRSTSSRYGGLAHLDFFLTALEVYKLKKSLT